MRNILTASVWVRSPFRQRDKGPQDLRLFARILSRLAFVAASISPIQSEAQGSVAYVGLTESGLGSAVDAKGVRHSGSRYRNKKFPPWIVDDRIIAVAPDYPHEDRSRRREGMGLFRLTLDLRTGSVTKFEVVRSTGFRGLDNSARDALRQWRWKPGKWKEIVMPVDFQLTTGPMGPPPPGALVLPRSGR
jgi:TonB family protein